MSTAPKECRSRARYRTMRAAVRESVKSGGTADDVVAIVVQAGAEPKPKPSSAPAPRRLSVRDVLSAVAERTGLPRKAILGRRRHRSVALARQLAMYLARKHTGASYPELGRSFERHHATVIHAVEAIELRMENDPAFRAEVSTLEAELGVSE